MAEELPPQSLLTLCWNDHRNTFPTVLSNFRRKNLYCDVDLVCGGQFYPAHRLILSACSDYFESIFQHISTPNLVIVLKEIVAEDMEALLNYMYEGIATVPKQSLNRLIKSAVDLQIKGLVLPEEHYSENIDRTSGPILATTVVTGGKQRETRPSPPAKKQRREENGNATTTSQEFVNSQTIECTTSKITDPYAQKTRKVDPQRQQQNKDTSKAQIYVADSIKSEDLDDLQQKGTTLISAYGVVVSDGSGNHLVQPHSHSDVVTHRFEPAQLTANSQPLAEAVAEALAGPSGMQTWLAPAELGTGNFTTVEAYNPDSDGTTGTSMQLESAPTVTVLSASESVQNNPAQVVDSHPIPTTSSATTRPDGTNLLRCHYCHRDTFRQTSDLKRHIRIHTGEKPFKCHVCSYKASRKDLLQAHCSKMHPNSQA